MRDGTAAIEQTTEQRRQQELLNTSTVLLPWGRADERASGDTVPWQGAQMAHTKCLAKGLQMHREM